MHRVQELFNKIGVTNLTMLSLFKTLNNFIQERLNTTDVVNKGLTNNSTPTRWLNTSLKTGDGKCL